MYSLWPLSESYTRQRHSQEIQMVTLQHLEVSIDLDTTEHCS